MTPHRPRERWTADDVAQWEARVAELNRRIAEYPYWGAALTAMDEERRGLLHAIRQAKKELGL